MRTLPVAARIYLLAIWACTTLIGLATLASLRAILFTPWIAIAAFVAVVIAGSAAVMIELQPGHRVSLTVHEALGMLFAPTLGIAGAWAFALGTAVVGVAKRRPWERTLFNAASYFLTYSCAHLAFTLLQPTGALPYSGPQGLLAFLGTAAAFYFSNLFLVGLMIALATGQPLLQVYRDHMRQGNWVHLLTFTVGAATAALYAVDPWLVVYGVLILVIAQRAFAAVVALNAETRRRQELAEERARLAEELHRQQDELAHSARLAALGTFSASIAHEFNNVLTAVIGHAQLGQIVSSPSEKDHALDVIARVSQRATSITKSLLTFARQREPELRLARIQAAIDDTITLVSHELSRDQVTLVQKIADLPPMMCDLGQISQVLLNLITNSRDALREQGGGTITITLAQEADQALLTVTDDGPGIPPEILDKIFQPFVTTKARGTGLGMAICYGIVESHHGKISITSAPGCGTSVTIRLPLRPIELLVAEPALTT